MPSLRGDDLILIDHARLRAPNYLQAICQQQLYSLTDIPQNTEAYLFLRKVSVKSPANHLADRLQQIFLEQNHVAVSGDSAEAENAQAVRFSSLGELLARLSQDIQARRQGLWYWQSWEHLFMMPVADALAQLWAEYYYELTDMLQVFIDKSELEQFWLLLSQHDADSILYALSQSMGLKSVPSNQQLIQQIAPQALIFKTALKPWEFLSKKLAKQDSRLSLAATLILLRWRADLLLPSQIEKNVARVVNQLCHYEQEASNNFKPRLEEIRGHLYTVSHQDKKKQNQRNPVGLTTKVSLTKQGLGIENTSSDKTKISQPINNGDLPITDQQNNEEHKLSVDPSLKLNTETLDFVAVDELKDDKNTTTTEQQTLDLKLQVLEPSVENVCITENTKLYPEQGASYCQQGGIFYLLNFMARKNTQKLLKQDQAYDQLQGAWGCLYRLAGLLELEDDPALQQFFVYRMGLDTIEELTAIPTLAHAEHYQQYAEKLYGSRVWNPQLLSIPAKIQYTASHLDIHYPIQKVQIEVRRVGLDINPGWLPWLGQVVSFHYHDDFLTGAEM